MVEDRFMLKYDATDSIHARGHTLNSGWHDTGKLSYAKCGNCNMEVGINTNPLPNEINIFGEAVAMNCPATANRKFAHVKTDEFNVTCEDCLGIVDHYSDYFKCEDDCKNRVCANCQPKHKCKATEEFTEHTHRCMLCEFAYDCMCELASNELKQGHPRICIACVRVISNLGRVHGEFSHSHEVTSNPPYPKTGVALSPLN